MRNRQTLSEREAAIEFFPANMTRPLNFTHLFPQAAPIEIDLGCGDGAFLTALAGENSKHNFLGIERLAGRVRSVCRKASHLGLTNVRVLRLDSSYAVSHLIPPATVARFHLLFPDPWPKRRHHRRRTVTAEFMAEVHRALEARGHFHIVTDHIDYFREIERLTSPLFHLSPASESFPQSTFERVFIAQGLTIHRLLLRKI